MAPDARRDGRDQPVMGWAAGGPSSSPNPILEPRFEDWHPVALTDTRDHTGPCYFQDETGEDISLGLTGLPMQPASA